VKKARGGAPTIEKRQAEKKRRLKKKRMGGEDNIVLQTYLLRGKILLDRHRERASRGEEEHRSLRGPGSGGEDKKPSDTRIGEGKKETWKADISWVGAWGLMGATFTWKYPS